jgi:WXG100 family type VII secretion target
MTAPRVRADYDQLKGMAGQFGGQAQAAQQTLQALQRELDTLQGGDWVGTGASAFYAEMGSQVLPTLRRLANALATAQQTTLQIHEVMAQAEAEAARWLRGEGNGAAVGLGGAAAFTGGAGAGAGSGPAAPGPVNVGGAGGTGVPTGTPAAGPLGSANQQFQTLQDAVAKMVAEENAAVDSKLAGFSDKVREMVKKSPHLRAQIFGLQQDGINFQVGTAGQGSSFNSGTQTITIEPGRTDREIVASIAHEVGHARSKRADYIPDTPTMTRDAFVDANVDNQLKGEADAQLNAAIVRAEVKANGGPDIGIPGTQTAKYQAVYNKFVKGDLTHDQAIEQMATLMGNERVSTPPIIPYRDYYGNFYRDHWDKHIAPTRTTP